MTQYCGCRRRFDDSVVLEGDFKSKYQHQNSKGKATIIHAYDITIHAFLAVPKSNWKDKKIPLLKLST